MDIQKVFQVHIWVPNPKTFKPESITDELLKVLAGLSERSAEVLPPIVYERGQQSAWRTKYILRFRVQLKDLGKVRSDEVVGYLSQAASRLPIWHIKTDTSAA